MVRDIKQKNAWIQNLSNSARTIEEEEMKKFLSVLQLIFDVYDCSRQKQKTDSFIHNEQTWMSCLHNLDLEQKCIILKYYNLYTVLTKHKPNLHQTTSMDTDDVEEYNNKYQTYIVQEWKLQVE